MTIFRSSANPVLAYHSYPDHLQLGWTLPHRGYAAVAEHGIEHVKQQVSKAIPQYAELIDAHLHTLAELSLLDVFAGCAERWAVDGLLLIGDSAHTHSPIDAQGINLAIQDAVLAHPVLVDSLRARDAGAALLNRFTSNVGAAWSGSCDSRSSRAGRCSAEPGRQRAAAPGGPSAGPHPGLPPGAAPDRVRRRPVVLAADLFTR